jgi:hypothetical protein
MRLDDERERHDDGRETETEQDINDHSAVLLFAIGANGTR